MGNLTPDAQLKSYGGPKNLFLNLQGKTLPCFYLVQSSSRKRKNLGFAGHMKSFRGPHVVHACLTPFVREAKSTSTKRAS